MNQIPNIEETHNTREVEELVQKFASALSCLDSYCDGNGTTVTVGIDGNPEPAQCEYCYRERFPAIEDFRTTLHHQLQKAREELAAEVRLLVAKYYKTDEFDEVGFLNELQAELDQEVTNQDNS